MVIYWILYIISPLVASIIEAGYSFAALREVVGSWPSINLLRQRVYVMERYSDESISRLKLRCGPSKI
jgi:hypothetical protein